MGETRSKLGKWAGRTRLPTGADAWAMETEWGFSRQGWGRSGCGQRRPTEQRLSV